MRCYFIGYPDHSKVYKFYCPSQITKLVDSITAKILENDASECSCSSARDVNLEVEIVTMPISIV